MMLVSAGACSANELKTRSKSFRTLRKCCGYEQTSLNTCKGTIKNLPYCLTSTFGDFGCASNSRSSTLRWRATTVSEVMAGIGCAVVDVVRVICELQTLDIVTDGVYAMGA